MLTNFDSVCWCTCTRTFWARRKPMTNNKLWNCEECITWLSIMDSCPASKYVSHSAELWLVLRKTSSRSYWICSRVPGQILGQTYGQVEAVCYFNKRVWSSTCDKSASLTSSDTELKTTADIMPCCESYDRMRMGRGNYLWF